MVCHLHSICFFKCAYVGVCCMDHIWAFQWSIIRQCVWCRLYNINVNSWCSIGIMNLVTDNIWHNANWRRCMYTDYVFRKKKRNLPCVMFSSANDRLPVIRSLLSHILFKPCLNVLLGIKHSNDIWIRWGFPLILVCVELQDLSLSSPLQDTLIGSSKDEREPRLFSSHFFFLLSIRPPRSSMFSDTLGSHL